jgi:NAD(P)-dependent dehydrogenase (short-subunit alcohol dehydrogenase family)
MHNQGTTIQGLSLDDFMLPIDRFLRAQFITTKAAVAHMGKKRPGVILTLSTPGATWLSPETWDTPSVLPG